MSGGVRPRRYWRPTRFCRRMRRFDGTGRVCNAGACKRDPPGVKTTFGLPLWPEPWERWFFPETARRSPVFRASNGRITQSLKPSLRRGLDPSPTVFYEIIALPLSYLFKTIHLCDLAMETTIRGRLGMPSFSSRQLVIGIARRGFSEYNFRMSLHRSLRSGGSTAAKRNVLKRFERVTLLKKRGQWKAGMKSTGLPKTKPE